MLIYDITVAHQVDQICVSGCECGSLHLTIGELLKCIFERLWNNTKVSFNETSMIVFDNRSVARCYWTCRITCIKNERLIAVRGKCHPVGGSVFVIHGKVPRWDSMGRNLSYWWNYVLKLHFKYSKIKHVYVNGSNISGLAFIRIPEIYNGWDTQHWHSFVWVTTSFDQWMGLLTEMKWDI